MGLLDPKSSAFPSICAAILRFYRLLDSAGHDIYPTSGFFGLLNGSVTGELLELLAPFPTANFFFLVKFQMCFFSPWRDCGGKRVKEYQNKKRGGGVRTSSIVGKTFVFFGDYVFLIFFT